MKFITEIDLRDLYRKEPFTIYKLKPGSKLTPGARQFLTDQGIKMSDDGPYRKKNIVNKEQPSTSPEKKNNWRKKKVYIKIKSIEALFLLTEEELLSRDVFLAQSIINLGKQFSNIKNVLNGEVPIEDICCNECKGIKTDNFSHDIGDCFEITDFHMQLEKGRDIIILHRLRCSLREIEPVVLELYESNEDERKLCEDIIGRVNQIINTLSQIICSILGGEKCQRKN